MQRSCSPSSSHLSAIERTRGGHAGRVADPSAQAALEAGSFRNRCRVSRNSMSVAPEIAERGDTQLVGIEQAGAALALVAARIGMAAMGAAADHVTVGQEAAVGG